MASEFTRRTFLKGTAGALIGAAAAGPDAAGAETRKGSGEKLRLGIIGVGGRGEGNWSGVAGEEIVVLCDVDLNRVSKAAERFPSAEVVQDFRRVIDRNDLDGVVISTPDHWHAIPAVWAMQTGKHVYCEKPLARSIHECRVMADAARRYRRVTQMGTQIHAGSNYRRVVELVRAGAIGPVRRVEVWCEKRPDRMRRSTAGAAVPASLDYDLWVGPAEYRPYDPGLVPFNWRWWWEFGGGVLADMACHFMDLPHWALDLRHPVRVQAVGSEYPDADNRLPVTMRVDFHYPARGEQPPVQLTWWHGIPGPRDERGLVRDTGFRSGVLFHGTEGELLADYGRHLLLPEEKFRDYRRPDPTIPDSVGHHQEWIDAIKNGTPTTCNFDYSGALSETVLLGNVSYRLNRVVDWDPEDLRIPNVPESEWRPLLQPGYRGDWKLKR